MLPSMVESWQILPQDQMKYDQQFLALNPINGFVTGKNAKALFMQSGLPTNVLAQIWSLADIDQDGQLNKHEFSIAMLLIKKRLEGAALPSQLPVQLQHEPFRFPNTVINPTPLVSMSNQSSFPPNLNNGSISMQPLGSMGRGVGASVPPTNNSTNSGFPSAHFPAAPPVVPMASASVNYDQWTLKNQVKPRYRLEFNQQDHHRRGYLTGSEASRLLAQSELPQFLLAQIWYLADMDADGNMTFEEYCLAQFLIEQTKKGVPLPPILPEGLRQSALTCGGSVPAGSLTGPPSSTHTSAVPLSSGPLDNDNSGKGEFHMKSREDERRENFLRGQEELAKRQAMLKEQAEKEEEARREKERLEKERLEKARLEKERQRQMEIERQAERQRQLERERAEEARRLMEERERQRREAERMRLLQVEARRLDTGLQEKRREQELLEGVKTRQCEKGEDLARNQRRLNDLQVELDDQRKGIALLRDTIGNFMRQERDRLDQMLSDLNLQVEAARAEKDRMQKEVQRLRIEAQRSGGSTTPSSEQVKALVNSVQVKRALIEQNQEKLAAMEKELTSGGETLASRRNKAADVERRCRRTKSDLKQLQQQLITAVQRYSSHKKERELQNHHSSSSVTNPNVSSQAYKPWTKSTPNPGSIFKEEDPKRKYSDLNSHFMQVFAPTKAVPRDPFADQDASIWTEQTSAKVQPGSVRRYRAQFDFESRQTDELTFKKGDIIVLDSSQQGDGQGWLFGYVEGTHQKGLFPETYCVPVETKETGVVSADALLAIDPFLSPMPSTQEIGDSTATVSVHQRNSSSAWGPPSADNEIYALLPDSITNPPNANQEPSSHSASNSNSWMVEALYDWSAQSVAPHFLESGQPLRDLRGGERFLVNREEGEWSCTDDGLWFPSNYVRRVDHENPAMNSSLVSGSASSQRPLLNESNNSMIITSVTSDQSIVKATPDTNVHSDVTNTDQGLCITLYPFQSDEADDLNFSANQLIHILSVEGDWWRGYIDTEPNVIGVFPANYVRRLTAQEIESMQKTTRLILKTPNVPKQTSLISNDTPNISKGGSSVRTSTPISQTTVEGTNGNTTPSLQFISMDQEQTSKITSPRSQTPVTSGASSRKQSNSTIPSIKAATLSENLNLMATSIPVNTVPEVAEVIIPYTATGSEQLSLEVGQLIQIRKRSDTGWWEGEIQQRGQKRRVGWFPRDYVKVLSSDNQTSLSNVKVTSNNMGTGSGVNSQSESPRHGLESPVNTSARNRPKSSLGLDSPTGSDSTRPSKHIKSATSPQHSISSSIASSAVASSRNSIKEKNVTSTVPTIEEKVSTLYAFKAIHSDELSFEKGVNIIVISKDEPEWWRGRLEDSGVEGLFPVNYVRPSTSNSQTTPGDKQLAVTTKARDSTGQSVPNSQEKHRSHHHSKDKEHRKRQLVIQEFLETERSYYESLLEVHQKFYEPMRISEIVSQSELDNIFINWMELMVKSHNFYMALHIRQENSPGSEGVACIGDILVEHFSHLDMYVRFASCQNSALALLTHLESTNSALHDLLQQCQGQTSSPKLPLGSYFLKPVQRITRYKLLVDNILRHTQPGHIDHGNLEEAFNKISQLLDSVNESIRERENSHCLEWLQTRLNCEGLNERLTFNSNTNAVGPRKLLKSGSLYKVKSGKELIAFLFNDFLLFTVPLYNTGGLAFVFPSNLSQAGYLPLTSHNSGADASETLTSASGDPILSSHFQFRLYKHPILLNQLDKLQKSDGVSLNSEHSGVAVVLPQTGSDVNFVIKLSASSVTNTQAETVQLRARTNRDRDSWIEKIRDAYQKYQELENVQLQKTMSIRRATSVGRLLLTIVEGVNLKPGSGGGDGKADPYCEVTLGNQTFKTNVVPSSLNPKWNANMNFMVRSVHQEVLSIAVYDKDYFQPNDFLGRAELPVSEILASKKQNPGHLERELMLKGVKQGAIRIKMDLIMFERSDS